MSATTRHSQRTHLRALSCALGIAAGLVVLAMAGALWLEHRFVRALIPESFNMKDLGLAVQRAAFKRDDVLPLYGSSELVKNVPDKASVFFRRYPTDFTVCPVGKPGSDCLVMLQKLAAVGPAARGRKVVLSLSPSWFFTGHGGAKGYEGNFSPLLASETAFASELSRELRRDIARRMLEFPRTLAHRPVLRVALRRLAADTSRDRAVYSCLAPVASVQNALIRLEDHLATGLFVARNLHRLKPPSHREVYLNWNHLKARWSNRSADFRPRNPARQADAEARYLRGDDNFIRILDRSPEWGDLELLLRTLRELGVRPLVLSLPMNGTFFDELNVSAAARQHFYDRLHELAATYDVPALDFEEHEHDTKFFADTYDHPSEKGWIYFDEAIDAFFHDRGIFAAARGKSTGDDVRCGIPRHSEARLKPD